jgi:hypothetical protein
MFLEIQQLLSAKNSPMSAVKKKDVPLVVEIIGQGDDASFDRTEGQLREVVACIENFAIAACHGPPPRRS